MTEYLLIATHSGDYSVKKNDGTILDGVAHYLIACKKDDKTGIFNCKPIIIKAMEDVKNEALDLLTNSITGSVLINLYFDEAQKATGIKQV